MAGGGSDSTGAAMSPCRRSRRGQQSIGNCPNYVSSDYEGNSACFEGIRKALSAADLTGGEDIVGSACEPGCQSFIDKAPSGCIASIVSEWGYLIAPAINKNIGVCLTSCTIKLGNVCGKPTPTPSPKVLPKLSPPPPKTPASSATFTASCAAFISQNKPASDSCDAVFTNKQIFNPSGTCPTLCGDFLARASPDCKKELLKSYSAHFAAESTAGCGILCTNVIGDSNNFICSCGGWLTDELATSSQPLNDCTSAIGSSDCSQECKGWFDSSPNPTECPKFFAAKATRIFKELGRTKSYKVCGVTIGVDAPPTNPPPPNSVGPPPSTSPPPPSPSSITYPPTQFPLVPDPSLPPKLPPPAIAPAAASYALAVLPSWNGGGGVMLIFLALLCF